MSQPASFDPFSTKGLLDLPDLSLDASKAWSGFSFDSDLQTDVLTLAPPRHAVLIDLRPEVLRLAVDDTQPANPVSQNRPSSATSNETADNARINDARHQDEETRDWWSPLDTELARSENKLISWDNFRNPEYDESQWTLVSEAGPAAFDELLRRFLSDKHTDQIKYVKPDVLLGALFDLGLGVSSVLFQWDEQSQRFDHTFDDYTVSGLSKDVLQCIIVRHLDAGMQMRKLKSFTKSRAKDSSTRVALHAALASIINTLEDVVEKSRYHVRSIIQLQETFHEPFQLLSLLNRLGLEVRSVTIDKELVFAILKFIEDVVAEQSQFEQVMNVLFASMLQPSLDRICIEIGLMPHGEGDGLHREDVVSVLLPSSTATLYDQVKATLRVLQENSFDSLPILHQISEGKALSIDFLLESIVQNHGKAGDLERGLKDIVVAGTYSNRVAAPSSPDSGNSNKSNNPFVFSANLFANVEQESVSGDAVGEGPLQRYVRASLHSKDEVSTDTLVSCRQALDLSIGPFIKAQHRLISYSVLHILFCEHKFVNHVSLLGRFQLLSDGTFVSKLCTALYDPEQVSGEGKRTTYAKTGLRLQSRQTWPPASSELRLALMGILVESMFDVTDTVLTDSISFAIRDLSDEDLERCRDIDSIYALDFLRLNYKPPSTVIEAVITPRSLERYDVIFNQLLRLLRIKSLVQNLVRQGSRRNSTPRLGDQEHKFRVEIQQFTSALADYYQNTVIKGSWLKLESTLSDVEKHLKAQDYSGTLQHANGLDHLRQIHEDVLDRIVRGLLLKRRQSEVKGVVDRLFEVVLRFAAVTSRTSVVGDGVHGSNMVDPNNTTVSQLHKDFAVHVRTLIRHLRAEIGRADGGADMYEQLLLKIDWNGFWSR